MSKQVLITKASGDRERFSENKLRMSLKHVGASRLEINEVISHVKAELSPRMSTEAIYKHAHKVLKKLSKPVALGYSMKKAVMQLGPAGYAFEKFVGEILKTEGYEVKIGGIIEGVCVDHEVDIMAFKDNEHIFIECKFHNQPGIKTDLKVALYVRSRFLDIKDAHENRARKAGHSQKIHAGWLITNTKLTSKAIKYSKCVDQKVIGWDYPKGDSLLDMIMRSGIHPITCLTTLTNKQKQELLNRNIILCKDILNKKQSLFDIGVQKEGANKILDEVNRVRNFKKL